MSRPALRPLTAALAGLLLLLPISPARAEEPAAGRGPARLLHVCAGAAAALLVEAAAYPLVERPGGRQTALLLAGLGVAGSFLAGGCKEVLDLAGFGEPDWRDLFFTVLGGVVVSSLVAVLTSLEPYSGSQPSGISAALASFGIVFALPVAGSLLQRVNPSSGSRG